MVELDPKASRAEHEAELAKFVDDMDPELGAILTPYIRFAQLEVLNDAGRRHIRAEIAQAVRALLDPEGSNR